MTNSINYPHDRLFVASLIPYDEHGAIDEGQLRRLLRYFVSASRNVEDFGIIVNPEAGEVFYLTPDEQARVVEVALDEVGGEIPVWSGLLANTTELTVQLARRLTTIEARGHRVGGLFVMPPIGALDITLAWDPVAYPEVWQDMVTTIADALPDVALICHPVATPTPGFGVGLPLKPTVEMLRAVPQVVGWKMTYNYEGFRTVSRAIHGLDRHVGILAATAVNFHENLANGTFDGTVTGSFNYALEPMLEHIIAWRDNDHARATKVWQHGLAELHEYVYAEWGRLHVRYKTAAWLHGVLETPWMRPPMPRPRRAEVQQLHHLLAATGMHVIDHEEVSRVLDVLPR